MILFYFNFDKIVFYFQFVQYLVMICLHYLQFVLTEEPDLGGKISELKIYICFFSY